MHSSPQVFSVTLPTAAVPKVGSAAPEKSVEALRSHHPSLTENVNVKCICFDLLKLLKLFSV